MINFTRPMMVTFVVLGLLGSRTGLAVDAPPAAVDSIVLPAIDPTPEQSPTPVSVKPPKVTFEDPFPEDILRIKERGKLLVAQFHGERKGFFMYDNDNEFPDAAAFVDSEGRRVIGHDIEIAQKIADRLGVDLEVLRDIKSFNDVTRAVSRGEADLGISKLTVTMSRGQYVRFSDAYVNLRVGVLINRLREVEEKREGDVFNLLNHPDAKIAVQRGTSWVAIGKDLFPLAQLIEYDNMDAALDAVGSGETLGFLNDEWNIIVKLNDRPETSLRARLAFIPDRMSGIAIAVGPQSASLHSFVNLMVERDNLKTTPDRLIKQYFRADAGAMASRVSNATRQQTSKDVPLLAISILAAVLLVLLLAWLRLALTSRRL